MHKLHPLLIGLLLAAAVSLTGCLDLDVENQQNPDRERALATPSDVEALIASSYLTWWDATQKYEPAMSVGTLADELTSSWGNFGMRDLSSEPRAAYQNSASYSYRGVVNSPWFGLYSAISAASDGLQSIEGGLELAEEARARAFAKFVQGISHVYLAAYFDQAFVVDETIDLEEVALGNQTVDFQPYDVVLQAGITKLKEAAQIAENNDFVIPGATDGGWINGVDLTSAEFARVIHSHIARYMVTAARTPQERAAVDWNEVISHIDRGITSDFVPVGDGEFWWTGIHYLGQNNIWVRADYKTIGLADESGAYEAWLNTPVLQRTEFTMTTSDLRIAGAEGDDCEPMRTCPGTDFFNAGPSYFRPDRGTYHFSEYSHDRYVDFYNNGAVGPMRHMTVTEMNLLKAEALLRTGGDLATVADFINDTRVNRGGLEPAAASDGVGDPADGSPTDLGASSLWAKLKYEWRIENYNLASGLAYFTRRGWGELVTDSPIHLPVAANELETLELPVYTLGGGGPGSAPKLDLAETFDWRSFDDFREEVMKMN